jgi:hypothetical protein
VLLDVPKPATFIGAEEIVFCFRKSFAVRQPNYYQICVLLLCYIFWSLEFLQSKKSHSWQFFRAPRRKRPLRDTGLAQLSDELRKGRPKILGQNTPYFPCNTKF